VTSEGPGEQALEADTPHGDFVLYWMRTAVRGHENPALDVALGEARRLGRPLFVYHALSERYPYASDRHHRFILEGARDVSAELASRGIGYGFHLERPGHRGPHLVTLARRAARVVTEDLPVAPLERWTRALAEGARKEVWAVDTACLVPMRSVRSSETTRAFRFRSATQVARQAALRHEWTEAPDPDAPPFVPSDLPFEPIDLSRADLAELIAGCAIDHGVGPVPHTPGGSKAGYARWRDFVDQSLKGYARRRNNPLQPGVSRMSAYLHYGHVSPFRIAREAAAVGGKGAEKYLDELLVWRELAHAFCAHHPEHDTAEALPPWARESLSAHEGDARAVLSWERLARGRTGDGLWDAAQRSLVVHGELHNNVRMTWGKALLGWTRNAEECLDRLIDLNHRFALDGRDPSSFGGILWCLGQFDRPFTPERQVTGTVRSRSTERHARRLDLPEYRRRVEAPAWAGPPTVAVVGAGLAGLTAARTLQDHGLSVTVFDKGRRPGGRASTREHGDDRFDHGAQYFTVKDPRTEPFLRSWLQDGVVAEWTGRLAAFRGDERVTPPRCPRYVGVPGMGALAAHLAMDVDVRSGVRVESITAIEPGRGGGRTGVEGSSGCWRLMDDSGRELGTFGAVVVAVPPPQAEPLLVAAPQLAATMAARKVDPCWALLVSFESPLAVDFDGALLGGERGDTGEASEAPLAWVARNSSKPGRPKGESWVIHGSPSWSRTHLDASPEAAAECLRRAFEERFGPLPGIRFQRAHLWRYARPVDGEAPGALYDTSLRIGACGDALAGGRVEGAILSGRGLAGRILGQAGAAPANPLGIRQPVALNQLALKL
jgi:photolyase PhrII